MVLENVKTEYLASLTAAGFLPSAELLRVCPAFANHLSGRVTAEAVYARKSAPSCPTSVVDGAALASVSIRSAADNHRVRLRAGRFAPISTGECVPAGCDCVISSENFIKNDDGSITVVRSAPRWHNIRQIGEDICAGEMLLPSHTLIRPAAVGAMIVGGVSEIKVLRRPAVGILPVSGTGEAVAPILSAMLGDWGALPAILPEAENSADGIEKALGAAAPFDMLILCLAPSPEKSADAAEAVGRLGRVVFGSLPVRPGKGTVLGLLGKTAVIGIPGYPASAMLMADGLLRPLVSFLSGAVRERQTENAVLTRAIAPSDVDELLRVRLASVDGGLLATPLSRSSGEITAYMKSDGIVELLQSPRGIEAGETVSVGLLRDRNEIFSTLAIVGSHDPLLDELSELIHRRDSGVFVSSTHVGSMGGIMAVRRGEAHVAPCHLLDTATGEYNVSFIKKYFPSGGVKLIRCVGRRQGLIVRKGNPLHIGGFEDIAWHGVRYVNRQRGSGTRILTDYLLAKNGIRPAAVNGYEREEMTHSSVAAQIASGSADAGMGIYSAAKLFDLDFIPLCDEEYDLLIPDGVYDTPAVQLLLDVLRSEEFKEKLLSMGGYSIDAPGEPIDYLP